jgi:hypothetical protein
MSSIGGPADVLRRGRAVMNRSGPSGGRMLSVADKLSPCNNLPTIARITEDLPTNRRIVHDM